MAGEADGFLQRWSRRKQEAARVAPAPATSDPIAEAARKVAADAAEAQRVAEEESARTELLARLPKLEDLAADSDFRLFMHPLVPPALRSAALAKMWTLDPAIRDFVGPARDYAWDWNAPGGVPGGGPVPSLSEIEETLRKLTARLDRPEAPASGEPEGAKPAAPEAPPEVPMAAATETTEPPAEEPAAATDPAAEGEGAEAPVSDPPPRRHGGAMPA